MDVSALSTKRIDVANIPLQDLAANKQVPQAQKVQAASQAFEALLLRQILQETQKPVFASKYVGNSTIDGIYRDLVVNQLADNISKSGTLGLGKSLSAQLQRQTAAAAPHAASALQAHQQALHASQPTTSRASAPTERPIHD